MTNEQKTKMMNIINILKELIFYISRIIFLILGIYYLTISYIGGNIYKAALFDILKVIPGIGHIISYFQFLDKISLLVIVVPMAVVATSLFIENSKLKITSGLFSLGGLLLFIPHFSKLKNYGEGVRAGFLSIFNEDNLQNKEAYLRENLNKILLEKAYTINDPQNFINFIKKSIEDDWYFYKIPIKTMNQTELVEYTQKLAEKIIQNYNFYNANTLNTVQTITQPLSTDITPYIKIITIVATSAAAIIVFISIYKFFKGDAEGLQKGADLIINGEKQNKKTIDTGTNLAEKEEDILKMGKSDYESAVNSLKSTDILAEEVAQLQAQMAALQAKGDDHHINGDFSKSIENIQGALKKLAEIGKSQNLKQNEKLMEIQEKIQLIEKEVKTISAFKGGSYSEAQIKELNQLTAKAAESRLSIEAANHIEESYSKIQTLSKDTLKELKVLSTKYQARITDLEALQTQLVETQKRCELTRNEINETGDSVTSLFKKLEEQVTDVEGKQDSHEDRMRTRMDNLYYQLTILTRYHHLTEKFLKSFLYVYMPDSAYIDYSREKTELLKKIGLKSFDLNEEDKKEEDKNETLD